MDEVNQVDSCPLCGTPLEVTFCPRCSIDRSCTEPFVLELPDDDEAPVTERNPAPLDLGRIEQAFLRDGAPPDVVSRVIALTRRVQATTALLRAGLPVTSEDPRRSGISLAENRSGRLLLTWHHYMSDDGYALEDIVRHFGKACEVIEACGYVVARPAARALYADVFEHVARGAA